MRAPNVNQIIPAARPRAEVVREAAALAPLVAQAREAVESAGTPREVARARAGADVIRDSLNAAMDAAGEHAPLLAQLRRESEQVALNAVLKLGALVPRNSRGPRRTPDSSTLEELRAETGVSVGALSNYRALHDAFASRPEHFAKIAEAALEAGKSPPLGTLRKLADEDVDPDTLLPDAPRPPKGTGPWLGEAVKHAMRAHELCDALASNDKAPPRVRGAAKAYAEGVARFCGELRRALNGEVCQ